MLKTHENMTCEERVKFWEESTEFWRKECVRLCEYIDELMEEADVQETERG